jgi:hypothetical protein
VHDKQQTTLRDTIEQLRKLLADSSGSPLSGVRLASHPGHRALNSSRRFKRSNSRYTSSDTWLKKEAAAISGGFAIIVARLH